MENKNTLIALMLMLAVWFGYTLFFQSAPIVQDADPQPVATVAEPPAESAKAVEPAAGSPATATDGAPRASAAATVAGIDGNAPQVTVENEFYTAVFSASGGRLVALRLKNYRQEADSNSPPISLVEPRAFTSGTLNTSGSDGFDLAADAVYQLEEAPGTSLLEGSASNRLFFSHRRADGVKIDKIYTFTGDKYPFELAVEITNGSPNPISGNLLLALLHPWNEEEHGDKFNFIGPVTLAGEDVREDDPEKIATEARVYDKDVFWSGFENKYFMNVAIPLKDANGTLRIDKTQSLVRNAFGTPYATLQSGQSLAYRYLLYFGPRDLDILKQVDHDLDKAIDFGFFTPIATPLLHVLKFFYAYIGNYGVAIIILTVIIKLLFWPLTHKSYASMKGMQKLQPEMQKIREKYKNDRERQSREMMQLYKTHRVNPMGGCLPMVVQIPVFFALYKVLMGAIELRQAPFAFWLTDLSLKDPYYITPLIMGVTMFIQQKLTPSTMDPVQAKVFMMMPVIFTFLFLNFPSGLVVYWLVNNLLTIVQQYFIYKKKT